MNSTADRISGKQKKAIFSILLISVLIAMLLIIGGCTKPLGIKGIAIEEGTFSKTYTIRASVPTGGKLIVTFDDDSTKTIEITESMITGFDSSSLGAKEITITYEGKEVKVEITIIDVVNAISVKENSAKVYYGIGETFNDEDALIIVDWESAADSEVAITAEMLSGWDTSTVGSKTITVTYAEQTATFSIKVSGNIYSSLELTGFATTYYIGDAFAGATLAGTPFIQTGTYLSASITASNLSGFDTTTAGTKSVTVTYTIAIDTDAPEVVFTKVIEITVSENLLQGIEVPQDFQTEYFVGDEILATSKIIAKYPKANEQVDITDSKVTVTGFDTSVAAQIKIKIEYNDGITTKDIEVDIFVLELTGIAIDSFQYTYAVGGDFVPGKIKAFYTDSEKDTYEKSIDVVATMVTGFTTESQNYVLVTITYGDYSVSAYIYVGLTIK
ncbi:MAG: bacterial Ig-like domain-containing protein, partial [Christensenellaceae bacterium]|nr:bacterial Ig-like domain-containing protein [Christensenellaceae bacterium]